MKDIHLLRTTDNLLSYKPAEWWRWLGIRKPSDPAITIYRGVSTEKGTHTDSIKVGDWVTLDKSQAEMYADAEGGRVLSLQLPLDHLVEAPTNSPNSIELWYIPPKSKRKRKYHTTKNPLKSRPVSLRGVR